MKPTIIKDHAVFSLTSMFWFSFFVVHYSSIIMCAMAFQITGVSTACLPVCSGENQRKHQSSASLAFVKGNHRWPVVSRHKGPVTWNMFPLDDVMKYCRTVYCFVLCRLSVVYDSWVEWYSFCVNKNICIFKGSWVYDMNNVQIFSTMFNMLLDLLAIYDAVIWVT